MIQTSSMKTSRFLVIALAVSSATITHGQTPAPSGVPAAPEQEKAPAGVDPLLSSADPEYGYSREKPIKVGAGGGGVASERMYLSTLRDEAGKPVQFKRRGSFGVGPYGNVLDGYEVQTSTGRTVLLYIDMYHSDSDPVAQLAPKGLYKMKPIER